MNISVQQNPLTLFRRILACVLLLTGAMSITAQQLQPSNTSTKRHLTTMTASASPSGLRIVIGTSSPVDDAVGYRSGDNYVVVIPQAELSSLQIDMRLLKNIRIDTRDEDVAVSFKLESGAKAQLTREENRIVVTLGRPEQVEVVNSAPQITATITAPVAAITSPAITSTPITNTPIANTVIPTPQSSPNVVFDGLKRFFNTESVDVANIDLSTPESPAFTVLGFTPQTIVRPASPREFATSLINGLDKNGNFQSGLAIDTAPYLLFNGQNVTLDRYNRERLTRLLTRTQFSFAAVKGSSDDDPTTKLSLGLNFTLLDDGDPRIYRPGKEGDVLTCLDTRLNGFLEKLPPVSPVPQETFVERGKAAADAFLAANGDRIKAIAEQCREEGRKAHWNKTSWTLAFAPSWISKTGDSSDFKWNGGAVWTSYALGVGDTGQFILHGRFRAKEQVPDEANEGLFLTQNSALFGGRFRMGNPNLGFNIEGSFVHNRPDNKPTKNTYEFSLGVEKKISSNVYFVISAGSHGAQQDNTKSKGFVITSFKYGFSDKPKLATESN